MPLENLEQLGVRPSRDLRDLFASGLAERVERELAVLAAHVDAVEGHRVTMWIESQSAVAALQVPEWTKSSLLDAVHVGLRVPKARCICDRADERILITTRGPQPTGKQTSPLDYQHYLERQLAPAADVVLPFLGDDFMRLGGRQLSLS